MDFASLLSQENLFSGSKGIHGLACTISIWADSLFLSCIVDGAFECHWQSILAFRKIEHEVAATGAPFPFSDALRSDAVASAVHAALKVLVYISYESSSGNLCVLDTILGSSRKAKQRRSSSSIRYGW